MGFLIFFPCFFHAQCSEEAWDKIFDVNVKCSFLLAKAAVPHMLASSSSSSTSERSGGGSVVFVASIAGYSPMPVG